LQKSSHHRRNKLARSQAAVTLTTPVGRLVSSSLYKGSTQDAEGRPLTYKSGQQAGQTRTNYHFALAIAKTPNLPWYREAWGAELLRVAKACFPTTGALQYQGQPGDHPNPNFSYKVVDGDSNVPNQKGRAPNTREGYPGHWVLHFSNSNLPKIVRMEGKTPVPFMEPEAVRPGYYIQVQFTADGNASSQRPGLYLNHENVCFRAPGQEIYFGADASEAGFGDAPLPSGVSEVPSDTPMPSPTNGSSTGQPTPTIAPLPGTVQPNPAFLNGPTPAVPAPATVAPAVGMPVPAPMTPMPLSNGPSFVMTDKAAGWTREQLIGSGQWTDATLIAAGMMITA
jgi:hypothetical protein